MPSTTVTGSGVARRWANSGGTCASSPPRPVPIGTSAPQAFVRRGRAATGSRSTGGSGAAGTAGRLTTVRRPVPLRGDVADRPRQLPAGADAELGEDLPQVPFDGTCADEQREADLGVGRSLRCQPGDLRLLRCEVAGRLHRALANRLTGGQQLAPSALGKGLDPHRRQAVVRAAELSAGVDASPLPSEPLTVEKLGPGELDVHPRATQPLDGLAVLVLGGLSLEQQGTAARLHAEGPVRAAGPGHRRELLEALARAREVATAHGRFD